jgi:hypothetical protein|tara:strand:- start:498 stop:974 length:477 start_codon:yes stop_codon:yes gene_type:complete
MKILVLNSDMQPLNITSLQRGFNLVFSGKAEIVKYDESNPIVTSIGEYLRPLIIKLVSYVYLPFRRIPLSRNNIYRRDGYVCMYCSSKENLTLDHVTPKCKGGKNEWENLVTCCKKCNSKKGDKKLEQSGMKLKFKPYKPTLSQFAMMVREDYESEYL